MQETHLTDLAARATVARSANEFRRAALAWLHPRLDFDAAMFAPFDGVPGESLGLAGLPPTWPRWLHDLFEGAEATPTIRTLGIDRAPWLEHAVVGPLVVGGCPISALVVARGAGAPAFSSEELARLERALPVLALGEAVHAPASLRREWYSPPVPTTPPLTPREREILELLIQGRSNSQIALELGTSSNTVRNQLATLFRKTAVASRTELVSLALRGGLAG